MRQTTVKDYPSIPRVENAPASLFERGHLWIQEKVDGANLRFQLQESGRVRFGNRSQVFDEGSVPEPYRHAVRHVRSELDRAALRGALPDVESVVFFGEAMHRHTIAYDWESTPSFLGFDVWDDGDRRFLPPDAVEQIFDRLGLTPVNTFEKEMRAVDFDPSSFDVPRSAWYDGPAEGVIIRNKTGDRAKLLHPDFCEVDEPVPVDATAEELAARYVTDRRFEKLATKLEAAGKPVTVETLFERAFDDVVREEHARLFHGTDPVDLQLFRSAIAERAGRFVADRE